MASVNKLSDSSERHDIMIEDKLLLLETDLEFRVQRALQLGAPLPRKWLDY